MRISRRRALALCLCLMLFFLCLCPARASATGGWPVTRALIQTSKIPVAMDDPGAIYITTSTEGCTITRSGWYDSTGSAVVGQFSTLTVHLELTLTVQDGYLFAPNTDAYINNIAATVTENTGSSLTVRSKDYSPEIWAASPIKSPGPETVDEGGWCSFVVSGLYVGSYEWRFELPDGSDISLEDAGKKFPALDYTGAGTDKLILRNIPAEMDGWKIYCVEWSVEKLSRARTGSALLTVHRLTPLPTPTPVPTPTPSPTPSPSPSPSPSPTPRPTPSPSPSPTPSPSPSPSPTPEPTPSPSPEPELPELGLMRYVFYAALGIVPLLALILLLVSAIENHAERRRRRKKRRR